MPKITNLLVSFIFFAIFITKSLSQEANPSENVMVLLHEYKLPDFKINREVPDCNNVDRLSETVQRDILNLENVIKDNKAGLQVINEALGLINQCCAEIESLNMLQVSKRSMRQNRVKLMNAEMNEIINAKLTQIENFLQRVGKEDLKSKCKEVQEATKDLINYVNWVNEQIKSQLIDSYLATRISDLNALKTKCAEEDTFEPITLPRTPLTLQSLTNSDGFPSNPVRNHGDSSIITEEEKPNPSVVYNVKLNSTEVKFSSCSSSEYGLYDNDFQSPTYAVYQNQHFEASTTSLGFSVSDGSGNQRIYTIGSVTDKNVKINTNGKSVFSITKTSNTFSVKFMDGSVASEKLSSDSGLTYNLKIFGSTVVGYKACTVSGQVSQISLVTAVSTVTFEQSNF